MMLLALHPGVAWAEDPPAAPPPADSGGPSQPPPSADGASLPVVTFEPAAAWPPDALAQGLTATVLLELQLDAEGRVLDAEVIEPAGHGFDDAVLAIAPQLRFEPARDAAGVPVPARIQYAYHFSLDTVPTVIVSGLLRESGSKRPLDAVTVFAEEVLSEGDDDGARTGSATTDADGRFELLDLAPGTWRLVAAAPGYRAEELMVDVADGQAVDVDLWLSVDKPWQTGPIGEEMEVIGYRLPPEISERRLDVSEIRSMPGTGGDVVRAVQTQPGVARTPFNSGTLLVRGMPADASSFYLDGLGIPIVFHFGGLTTVISGDLLQEVRFLPGSYGVRYGRRLGGAVDLVLDDGLPERSSGYLSVDIFQAALFHEQRAGDHWSVTLSARRSYIDAVLGPIVNVDPTYNVRLPAFTDGQLRVLHRSDRGSTVQGILLASDDRFTYSETDLDSPTGTSDARLTIGFVKGQLRWQQVLGQGWQSELAVSAGPEQTRAEYLQDERAYEVASREDLRFELTRPVPEGQPFGWRLGIEMQSARERYAYQVDGLSGLLTFADDEHGEGLVLRPGGYLEQTQRYGPVDAIVGLRGDWMLVDNGYQAVVVDPRLRVRATVAPTTLINAAVGRYSQFPLLRELLTAEEEGGQLGPESAIQASVGVEQGLPVDLHLEATAYAAWLSDLVVGHDDRFEFSLAPPPMAPFDTGAYANDGTGRSLGLELLLRYETARTTAFAATTLSRSTRVERPGQPATLFEYDQPVILTLVASHQLPAGWLVGGRFRATSGNPYTPVANRVYDLDEQAWYPIFDASQTARMPAWWALDLRADKSWTFRRWSLSAYLDLQNATNRRNVELLNFAPDYSETIYVYGLPILPTLGVKAGW